MGSDQESVLGQSCLCEGMAAGNGGVRISPLGHPRGLLYFDRVVVEVAQAVECLTF